VGRELPKLVDLNVLDFLPQRCSTLRLGINGEADADHTYYAAHVHAVLQLTSKLENLFWLRPEICFFVFFAKSVFLGVAIREGRHSGRLCRATDSRLNDCF